MKVSLHKKKCVCEEGKYAATGRALFYTTQQHSAFIQRGAVNDKFPYKLMLCTLLESQPAMIHCRFGLRKLPTMDGSNSWPPQPHFAEALLP